MFFIDCILEFYGKLWSGENKKKNKYLYCINKKTPEMFLSLD